MDMKVAATEITLPLGPARLIVPADELALAWIEKLQRQAGAVELPARLESTTRPPAIGAKGEHGIYVGIARGRDGGPDYALEVLEEAPKALKWQDAVKWAESIGGTLPTRKEQALMFANVPELFQSEYYWSGEQVQGNESYAWCQYFGNGDQGGSRIDNELRARAVRRLIIE